MHSVVKTDQLKKDYRMGKITVPALRGVDIEIEQGEFVCIMGSSGSGKSTLLNLLGMLDKPTSGKINIEGHEVSELTDDQRADFRLRKLGFIFQFFNLFWELSALENTMLPLMLQGVPRAKCKSQAIEMLELVGLRDRLHHKPSELSGGQQQRVAIARALINHPSIVLADEPTGNLDSKTSKQIIEMLGNIKRELHQTVILVTHEKEIGKKADRIIYLRDGKLEFDHYID